jgi:aromatic amino acid aminotransferase I
MPVATSDRVAIDYASYFSLESKNRERSRLKEIKPFSEIPGMINVSSPATPHSTQLTRQFGVGIPHPSTFPVDGMTLSLPFVKQSAFVPGYGTRKPEDLQPLAAYTPADKETELNPDLAEELQYSATFGQKHLLRWLKEHISRIHSPSYDDWEILCTAGNTDGVDGVMRGLLDRGDYLLVEEFGQWKSMEAHRKTGLTGASLPRTAESCCNAWYQVLGCADGHQGYLARGSGENDE